MAKGKKRVRLAKGAAAVKIKFDESKHKRDGAGKFDFKPGANAASGKHALAIQAKGKTSGVKNEDVIKLHTDTNPKKAGSTSAADYAKYKDGMTVAEFKAAVGTKGAGHISHDMKKGYISIHEPGSLPKAKLELTKAQYMAAGKTSGVKGDDVIKLHPGAQVGAGVNPKKVGSKSFDTFAKYKDEMTVDDFVKAGGSKADIAWDSKKGFISIHTKTDLQGLRAGAKLPPVVGPDLGPAPVKAPVVAPVVAGPKINDNIVLVSKVSGNKMTAAEWQKTPHGLNMNNLKPLKVSDLAPTDNLALITSKNPYKEGSPEFIKYKAFELQHGKPHTLTSYNATKSLTPTEKAATLQKLMDDGHVKYVPKAQLEAIAAAKAASPVKPIAQKPVEWSTDDPRWSKAPGAKSLEDNYYYEQGSPGYGEIQAASKHLGAVQVGYGNTAVSNYKGNGYISLNSGLRAGGPANNTTKTLDSIMRPVENDVIMYRGHNVKVLNGMPPPGDFVDLGFTSVSYKPRVAKNFSKGSKTIFRVRVPKGAPAFEMKNDLSSEAEVVLARKTRYKYVATTNEAGYKVIEVEVVKADGSSY